MSDAKPPAGEHHHGPHCQHEHEPGPGCQHEHQHGPDCQHGHDHHHHHGHEHGPGCGHEHHHSEMAFHSHGSAEIELDFSIMLGISLLCGTFILFGQVARWQGAEGLLINTCFVLGILVGGAIPMLEALPNLLRIRPDIESLMVFAAVGAWALGEPRDGAMLMFLFSGARALEAFAVGKTRQSLRALKEHWKESATRLRDGEEETVPISELQLDDVVLVRPGERIPLDALVVGGSSAVNEAAITGEPLPVDKESGASVFGGTLNLQGVLRIQIQSTVGESTLARTIRLLEEAQEQEALTQRVVEWATEHYSTLVLLATIFVVVIPYLYFRQPISETVTRALTLLVVASPCALAVSTPATLFFAITAASRRGILLKGTVHLEAAAAVRVVALDKTGTLTRGEPHVTGVHVLPTQDQNALLAIAAAVERLSEHPLAKPVVDEARQRGLTIVEATDFQSVTGRGVQALVGAQLVRIGSPIWMRECAVDYPAALREVAVPLEERGERSLLVAVDSQVAGLIAVADTIRPEAAALVRDLKRTGIRRVVMLTGDSRAAAEAIGAQCGLDEVRAELLPQHKLEAIEELRETYGRVVMVGDGVNDAPALARADVGVAMGGIGSDLALESADVVLTTDDLWRLPAFLDLAKKSTRMLLFNLAVSLAVISVLVALVISSVSTGRNLTLVQAAIGHEGSTIFVILNAMRLLRWKSRYDYRL
ncbi:MAG: heavy metal translocating P-type ATPase [Fimbriimonadaceae bacterium]|nr:heavy metal translocating P-type ATPase [Fimbriimonadaceae bacterium]